MTRRAYGRGIVRPAAEKETIYRFTKYHLDNRCYHLESHLYYHGASTIVNILFEENKMPSDKPQILIRTDKELITKLDIIAKKNNRSRANLAETILKQYVEQYELENGRINNLGVSVTKTG